MPLTQRLQKLLISPKIHKIVEQIPKSVGTLGYDPWGYHEDVLKIGLSATQWLYEHYFRVEAFGLDQIPRQGRAFVIANHSGQIWPMDGLMIGYSLATNPHGPRAPRAMIERFIPSLPFVGNLFNRWGAVLGDPVNCTRMLEREEMILVFPEGERGFVKPWSQRYQLQRMGTGFMRLAIATQTPIIPVGVVGCEEMGPTLGRIDGEVPKKLGFPVLPLALPLPLPVRIRLHFGAPLSFQGDVDSEAEMVQHVETVKQTISELIQHGLKSRESVFF